MINAENSEKQARVQIQMTVVVHPAHARISQNDSVLSEGRVGKTPAAAPTAIMASSGSADLFMA
jgi:hypothetical protein